MFAEWLPHSAQQPPDDGFTDLLFPTHFFPQCSTVQAFCAGLRDQLQLYQERLACIDMRKALPIPGDSRPLPSTLVPANAPGRPLLAGDVGSSASHGGASTQNDAEPGERGGEGEGQGSAGKEGALSSTEYVTMAKFDLLMKQWRGRLACLAWIVAECR